MSGLGLGNRRLVVVCDYDRTLTSEDLALDLDTFTKIGDIKRRASFVMIVASGRFLRDVLEMRHLKGLADALVVENGAIVYLPDGSKFLTVERRFDLRAALAKAEFEIDFGEVIASTKRVNYEALVGLIEGHNIDVDLVYNRDYVMVLPKGVDKGLGVAKALDLLGVSNPLIIAFGDGENDEALFRIADVKVAVGNAVAQLKEKADFVSDLNDGEAVIDYLSRVVESC